MASPDLQAAAAEAVAEPKPEKPKPGKRPPKKRGRKPGSKVASDGKVIPPEPERPPYQPDAVSIAASAMLGRVLWKLVGTRVGLRPLEDDEALALGQAVDPVLAKWLPELSGWAEEINLALTIAGLVAVTMQAKPELVEDWPGEDRDGKAPEPGPET